MQRAAVAALVALSAAHFLTVSFAARFARLPTHPPPLAAALLRQLYIRQGLGVGQLRVKYGGLNKRRGVKPEHFAKSSGGLIRHILKSFESLGFVEKHTGACSAVWRATVCGAS